MPSASGGADGDQWLSQHNRLTFFSRKISKFNEEGIIREKGVFSYRSGNFLKGVKFLENAKRENLNAAAQFT